MIGIADSGSTKTEWCFLNEAGEEKRVTTRGLNPFMVDNQQIRDCLEKDLYPFINNGKVKYLFFYGSGCANIFAWPLSYRRKGQRKAVIGGADPSCRPFMGVDELSFTVTTDTLLAMQEAFPRSFLAGKTWTAVRKKIDRSRKVWEEAASG